MKPDLEIARSISLKPIQQIAQHLGIGSEKLIPYGKHIAKLPISQLDPQSTAPTGKLILVTAMTPTRAGIGKTTVSIGLALGLEKMGKKATVALREPSLGVCFGMKGGAAGGGYSQVLPMEDINLHFTGDFHAITSAHNMITALLDNYQHVHRNTEKQLKEILWNRVLDVNDRALRQIVTGLGGNPNGVTAESGFDITPASEIMAIVCLANSLDDLQLRINRILLGYTHENQPFTVADLGIGGAITVLLKDAIHPNLVQTTENTAAFIHGGPFANIAHGCNSVMATRMAMSFSDYVVTEAGFGADLGAEKFFNIKCRSAKIQPQATVLVITSQALKFHGGVEAAQISEPNSEALSEGLKNVKKHIENLQHFGQSVVVAFNRYGFDVEKEIALVADWCKSHQVPFAVNESFELGGEGGKELAKVVTNLVEEKPSAPLQFTYFESDPIDVKIKKIATSVYGADGVNFDGKALKMLKTIEKNGWGHLPVCIAKTQYSFSDQANKRGVAKGFQLQVQDLIVNSGAGFIVAKAGTIMRMPGLPKVPQANFIDLKDGEVEGLS